MKISSVVSVVLMGLQVSHQICTPGELTVTGGGIVRKDEEVTFSLCLEENRTCSERDIVTWKLTPKEGEMIKCQVKSDGTINCNSDDLKSKLVPVQNSSANACQIKLEKFSPELEGVWKGETWPEEGRVELVMQQDVSRLEVSGLSEGEQVEGQDITLTCTVEGGTPQPSVKFVLMKADNTTVENSSERFTNRTELSEDGKVTAILRLSKEDQGLHVGCQTEQLDNNGGSLAIKDEVTTAGLNVRFSPEEISIHINDSQILHLNFHSNPVPANVTFITEEADCGDDCKTSQHTVLASDIEEKAECEYHINFNLTVMDNLKTAAKITVMLNNGVGETAKKTENLETAMSKPSTQSSTTMSTEDETSEANTENSEAKNETSTVSPEGFEEEDEGLGAGAIVAIVFVILGVIFGLFLFYKRKRDTNERLPLNNIPSMSSLQSR